ncbi:MAG: hypothetical protein LGL72_14230 [Acidibrevibacterium sp.]|uniref:hypothetical protein n=1 Tax=Acidibrevibacterium fodinaquatile TaxID=1969806 RepID=UPI0013B46E42|nr:hypothetical protein [Acidibrevibacterium fodinaquatile]MCA7120522.1 hypothetical protein [Acidibrevibacterium fodinaquatile]
MAPVNAIASPVEIAIEPMVCRSVCGVTPFSFAFSIARAQIGLTAWKYPSPRSASALCCGADGGQYEGAVSRVVQE